jgi:predicted adenylyl cyclase CyaB
VKSRRNIELKARCTDLARAEKAAQSLGATSHGVLVQTDTYFHVIHGRLKLREIEGRGAELIRYERADKTDFRASDYDVVPVANPAELKAALGRALGVRGEVHKRRLLYLWQNVRIHLDDVRDLGTFIEFEAVLEADADESESLERLKTLAERLAVRDDDRIAQSYSDLLGY